MLTMFLSFLLKTPQASRQIIEKYYSRLTLDFATNKRIADEIAIIPSIIRALRAHGINTIYHALLPHLHKLSA